MRTLAALILLASVASAQSSSQTIGKLMRSSPNDYANVQSGCGMCYDKAKEQFVCCGTWTGKRAAVTLSAGTLTVVTNSKVTSSSRVRCGCEGMSGTGTDPACNNGGSWLARIQVRSTSAGSFEIVHGEATGTEVIVCEVDG